MSILLTVGTSVGFALGVIHGRGVFGRRMAEAGASAPDGASARRLRAAYAALWTVALWTLFGSYVLLLWIVSVPLWVGSRARRAGAVVVAEA